MSDREHHCPFLNRADHRCSTYFSIEQLQHAFEHCFNAYKSCAVYRELLCERQTRREQAALNGVVPTPAPYVWTTACPPSGRRESHANPTTTFVQVRLPGGIPGAGDLQAPAAR